MNKKFFLGLLLASCLEALGGGAASVESTVIHRVTLILQLERNLNKGLLATNWHQIEHALGSQNKALMQHGLDPLQSLYVFTPTNLLLPLHKGYVIVARHKPVDESGRHGRYVVYNEFGSDPEFGVQFIFILEEVFQQMLKESGVKLPDPNPEEVRVAREAVEKAAAEEKALREVSNAPVPGPTFNQGWLLLKDRIKRLFLSRADERDNDPHVRLEAGFVRVRVVPVVLASLSLVAIGFFAGRMLFRRKPPTNSTA